jgi:hypothetical protein
MQMVEERHGLRHKLQSGQRIRLQMFSCEQWEVHAELMIVVAPQPVAPQQMLLEVFKLLVEVVETVELILVLGVDHPRGWIQPEQGWRLIQLPAALQAELHLREVAQEVLEVPQQMEVQVSSQVVVAVVLMIPILLLEAKAEMVWSLFLTLLQLQASFEATQHQWQAQQLLFSG